MIRCGIYAIRRKDKMEAYVGQSIDIDQRIKDHFKRLRFGDHRSDRFQKTFNKYGENYFYPEVVAGGFDASNIDLLTCAEQEWMDYIAKDTELYNTCIAATSRAGLKASATTRNRLIASQRKRFESADARRRCSEGQKERFKNPEERARLGACLKGRQSPWKGKTPSAATRALMSAKKKGKPSAFKGKTHSQAAKEKNAAAHRGKPSPKKGKPGKPHSEETKRKMSAAHQRRKAVKPELLPS